jgi:hypothetical protein
MPTANRPRRPASGLRPWRHRPQRRRDAAGRSAAMAFEMLISLGFFQLDKN